MTAHEEIIFKTVKVSDKGKITIPSDMLKTMKIKKGEELLIIRKGNKLLVEKSSQVSKKFESEFDFMIKNVTMAAKKLWNNKEDEIWNTL